MQPDAGEAEAYATSLGVSRESLKALHSYVTLLMTWQTRINLIGPSTVQSIWSRHIVDSLQLLPLMKRKPATIAELGSGAGIPGLILAIATGRTAHLYESNGKKAAFLREASRVTGAKTVVHNVRLETLKHDQSLPQVDYVVARALAPLPLLLEYAEPFMSRGAVGLFHKGQDVELELTEATKYWMLKLLKHQSVCDSRGVILEIDEVVRV